MRGIQFPPAAAWKEPADATDTGLLVGIAGNTALSVEHRAYLECIAWRLAKLLDDRNGTTQVQDGLRRFIEPVS